MQIGAMQRQGAVTRNGRGETVADLPIKELGDEAVNLPRGVIGPIVNDEYADVTFALYALKAKGEMTQKKIDEWVNWRDARGRRAFVVPSAAAFLLLGDMVASVVLVGGAFTYADAVYVWAILAGSTPAAANRRMRTAPPVSVPRPMVLPSA